MVKTTELRIGNWVYSLETNTHVKITATDSEGYIAINTITFDVQDESMINPIELTEEILLKCGFGNLEHNYFIKNGFTIEKVGGVFLDIRYGKVLNALHKLQNLYFALTDKELEYEV